MGWLLKKERLSLARRQSPENQAETHSSVIKNGGGAAVWHHVHGQTRQTRADAQLGAPHCNFSPSRSHDKLTSSSLLRYHPRGYLVPRVSSILLAFSAAMGVLLL